jgi:hypothetical protein
LDVVFQDRQLGVSVIVDAEHRAYSRGSNDSAEEAHRLLPS